MTATFDEEQRVRELLAHIDPDAPADPEVEALVERAAAVAGVPMAALNLLDRERQCQPAAVGFTGRVTARSDAMCSVALEVGGFVHTPDARRDPRFQHNPWVDGRLAQVRFYASAPLVTRHGYAIGTLCVFDTEPHHITDGQARQLQALADQVITALGNRAGTARRDRPH